MSFSDLVKEKPLPNGGTLDTQNGFGRRLTPTFLRRVVEATGEGPDSASASRSLASYSGGTFSSSQFGCTSEAVRSGTFGLPVLIRSAALPDETTIISPGGIEYQQMGEVEFRSRIKGSVLRDMTV
jgi:hypothetical protein